MSRGASIIQTRGKRPAAASVRTHEKECLQVTTDLVRRAPHILLAEDNPADMRLTLEALKEAKVLCHLHWVKDGVEALDYLHRRNAHAESVRPDLILLDLNLPRMDGREVLARIKADLALKTIPTVILTTSEAESDIVKSYELQANCYLSKPVQLEAFESLVKSINDFWLTKVKLPQQASDRPVPASAAGRPPAGGAGK